MRFRLPALRRRLGLALARHLSLGELGALATAFGAHLVAPGLYARTTVAEWMDARGFSTASRARLDQMCATVDGAGAARMTLAQLLEVLNQNLGYQIKQPRRANDVGVFADWKRHLERNHCEFWMEERVTSVGPTRLATSRRAALDLDPAHDILLLAVPPKDAHAILQLPRTKELAETSSYNTYIPITFHWHARVRVPSAWGGAKVTPWGMLFIAMSEYLEGEPTQTIVQASIAFVDRASDVTGKTANETPREADLVAEAWRQLGLDMPRYDVAIVSPRVWYGDGRWHNADTAYMHTTAEVNSDARVHANVFVIGAHNRRGWYAATALEAACANAVSVMAELVPETSGAARPRAPADGRARPRGDLGHGARRRARRAAFVSPSKEMKALTLLAAVLVLLMFVVSAVYKFRDMDSYTALLAQKIGGRTTLARVLIYCAALLQLLAPLVIVAHFAAALGVAPHPWLRALAVLACVGLVLFTVIATVMFKLPSFNPAKPWPLLSNVSVAGGLALLAVNASA